jgi:hypothetical protein
MNILKRTLALTISTVFLATGCAQLQNVPLAHSEQGVARPNVQVGDNVVVTTKDGAKHKFQVLGVEADSLRGQSDRVCLISYSGRMVPRRQLPSSAIREPWPTYTFMELRVLVEAQSLARGNLRSTKVTLA